MPEYPIRPNEANEKRRNGSTYAGGDPRTGRVHVAAGHHATSADSRGFSLAPLFFQPSTRLTLCNRLFQQPHQERQPSPRTKQKRLRECECLFLVSVALSLFMHQTLTWIPYHLSLETIEQEKYRISHEKNRGPATRQKRPAQQDSERLEEGRGVRSTRNADIKTSTTI